MSEPDKHRSDSAPSSAPAPPPESAPAPPPPRRKRKRPWFLITAVILLFAVAATLTWTTVYLYQTTSAWQDNSAALTSRVQDLANDLATVQDDLHATEEALARTETQLDTARDRITSLADEKAQLGDEHAVQQRLVEYQEHVSDITADVLFVLDECIGGQANIIKYLKTPEDYDEDELRDLQSDVSEYCADATGVAEDLMEELSQ